MKHNLLKSVILSVILLMGVSNAWAGGGIYLKPNSNWTQANARFAAYFFKSSNESDNKWMSMYASNKSGYYVCAIPDGYDKVILCRMNTDANNNWNNKWNQTGNLDVPSDEKIVCSINDGQWDCGNAVTWSAINWYIAGDFNGWNTTANKMPCDISIESGNHTMKIVSEYGDWFGNTGTMIRGNSSGWTMTYGENSNCTLTADVAGTYNFSCTGTKLTVTYPEQCFLKGSFNDWEETHSILNGSVTVTLAAGTHTFKIYRYDSHGTPYWCGNSGTMSRGNSFEWVMQSDISDDCTLTADRDGDYTFEYNRSTGKLTVEYPGEDYYLTGDFNSWASNTSSSFISNNSITVPLTKGIHEFKIHHIAPLIDAHYGNNGTMTRVACTGWTMETEKDNCKIEADITGDYIFTFNKSTKKVTVEYPEYGEKKTIYLNINEQPTWVAADAKMAVRYDGTNYDMTPIGCDAKGHYLYSCDNIPIEKNIRFVRINPNNTSQIWNESSEYAVPAGNNLNCFKMTAWGTGNWGTFEEIYPVTLDPHANFKNIDFGSYSVRYNGTTYTSKPTETVTFYAPAGAQIEILEGDPINDAYYARVRAQAGAYNSIYGDDIAGYAGQTITVCGQTGFDNEFLTRASHVVYLGVPNSGSIPNEDEDFHKWRDTGYKYFIWKKDCPEGGLVESTKSFTIKDITYYEFTIPAGNRNIEFQRKEANNTGTTYVQTIDFPYGIPTTSVNCFTLDGNIVDDDFTGSWGILPAQAGDYRLLYVEQQVAKEDWKTVINTTYQHASDIIKKGNGATIVSLHIGYDKTQHPEVILQKFTDGEWVDVEGQAHMVLGPLTADAGMAMIAGRRNTEGDANLRYDDGIEEIKDDAATSVKEGRVWNFTVQQSDASAYIDFNALEPYEGNYYIRTDNAVGGWNQYLTSGNVMNYSKYAEDHSGFSHYFCKYVDIAKDPKNVKFVIANDHGTAISDPLDGDDFVPKENNGSIYKGELQESANVRWSWNQYTNEVKRAYIKGSSVVGFLTVTQTGGTTTNFEDNGNWIYEADITAAVGDKITAITAPYRNKNQSLLELTYQTEGMPLLTGDQSGTHDIHVMYDFKINKTMALLVPGTGVKTTIDVLIERTDHGQATQVRNAIQKSDESDGYTVYAALNFTKTNVENAPYTAQRLYYWVSFPFDVRISEVFGFGEYGKHWIMQYYDGAARAANGAWADSPSYWRNITDTANLNNSETLNSGILKANQGYVLALAKKIATMGVFEHTNKITLYFPSMNPIEEINQHVIETKVTLASYQCNINRNTKDGDRRIKDSHWHVLGVPSYSDHSQKLTQDNLMYFYERAYANENGYTVQSANEDVVSLKSLHSYYVQFAGTINWRATWTLNPPAKMAARKNVAANESHILRLELQQNGANADQTFITLKDEDDITPMFDMNKDLTKIINSGANIYTLIDTETGSIEVAGNVMPISSAIIPVGIQVATAGEYTFAMPDGTDGIIVELVDYDTNTRTNLLLSDYTVTLPAGTNESRFALHVQPSKVTTSTENISGDGNTNTKKYLLDGVLYLQKDGMLYDAQGHIVR